MFHLLVAYEGWAGDGGSISNSRIYIKSDEEPGKLVLNESGQLDATKVIRFPALLMTELGGQGSQLARVVNITSVAQGERETFIQYVPENGIQPIPNEEIETLASQLNIDRNALTHTHWEIKQTDLFKVLLMNQQKSQPASQIFSLEARNHPLPSLISIMMPFASEFDPIYTAIQSAVNALGLKPMRADNIWEHHTVIQDIVDLIAKARVVICDLSGKNPNVFYETGIAHALGKEVILITQSKNDVPFDLQHIRHINYLNNAQGLTEMTDAITSRIQTVIGK
jgi:predicted regulator of amino acid metabolism with ACT domain